MSGQVIKQNTANDDGIKKTYKYQTFIFTHIPKCAGTSFRKFLYDVAIASEIEETQIHIPGTGMVSYNKNLNQLSEEEILELRDAGLKILANHSKYKEHEAYEIIMPKPFYFTVLREPIARFISHYNFFYFKHGQKPYKDTPFHELPENLLLKYLNKLSNIQTNYIANVRLNKAFGLENVANLAKYNLQYKYNCFGIVEQLDTSMELLAEISPEWLPIKKHTLPISNANKSIDYQLPDDLVDLIKEYNWMDIELYDFALNLFAYQKKK